MERIRIAYLIDRLYSDRGGTEKQLLEMIRRLDRTRFEPFLVCLYSTPWLEQNRLPCEVVALNYKGFLKRSFPGVVRRLAGFIRHRRVHIVQTFFEDSIFVGF